MNTALSILHPKVMVYEQEPLPYGGLYQGYAGYQQLFTELMKVWGNFSFSPQEFMDANDVVIAIVQLQGEAKATGKKLDIQLPGLTVDHHISKPNELDFPGCNYHLLCLLLNEGNRQKITRIGEQNSEKAQLRDFWICSAKTSGFWAWDSTDESLA